MPLKEGHGAEVVSSNVHELVRSGQKPKQAVAIALSSARRARKMAAGGLVEGGEDPAELSAAPVSDPADDEQLLALALGGRDGDGYVSDGALESDESESPGAPAPAEPAKPAPASPAPLLTDAAMAALADHKKKRSLFK